MALDQHDLKQLNNLLRDQTQRIDELVAAEGKLTEKRLNAQTARFEERLSEIVLTKVGEALEQVVLPRLATIESGLVEFREEVTGFREDVDARFDRVEKKLDAVTAVTDRHDRRLNRLEKHIGLPPLEPARTK